MSNAFTERVEKLKEEIETTIANTNHTSILHFLIGAKQACNVLLKASDEPTQAALKKLIEEARDRLNESDTIGTAMNIAGRLWVYEKFIQEDDK